MSYSPIGYLTYLQKGASQCQGQRIPRSRSMGVAPRSLRSNTPQYTQNMENVVVPPYTILLLSPLLSGLKRLIHLVWLYFKNMMKENTV